MSATRTRPWWLVPAVVYLAALIAFLAWSPASRDEFPLDDAWIHRVYARSFAWGHGFAYNDGVQEAGCTSPLWAILSAPPQWLEPLGLGAVVWAVKLLGAALGAAAVAAVHALTRRLGAAPWAAAMAAALFACEPALMFDALSGMEVVLLLALWLWALVAIHAQRWRATALLIGLLPVARPEGVLLAAACVVVVAAQQRRQWRAWITPWTIAAAALPTALWIGFCELATGHLLPNTYYLKASGELGSHALALVFEALVQRGWARSIAWPLVGAAALVAWAVRRRAHAAVIALWLLGSLGFVVAVVASRSYRVEGYYWTRWTDPGVLGVAAASATGLALAVQALLEDTALKRGVQRAALAALALVVVVSIPALVASLGERADRLGSDGRVIARMNVAPARWLAAHAPADAVVGVNDAGALRYFGGRTTIDLIGLNNADLAFARVPVADVEARIDWIAVYPLLTQQNPALATFARQRWFTVPRAEYTICDCPGPTRMFVARRATNGIFAAPQRAAMLSALRTQPPGTPAWIVASTEPTAQARAAALRDVLREAGWTVDGAIPPSPLAPAMGWRVIAADAAPTASARAVQAALVAAGLELEATAGLRAVIERQRARGASLPALPPEQAFVIAVGRD